MAKVDPPPPDDEVNKRREPKFVINPYEVSQKEDLRARGWAKELMQKYEYKLTNKVPEGTILMRGEVEPEAIDVRQVYNFPNLHWIIFYRRSMFHLVLLSGHRVLFVSSFLKVN